MGWIEVEAWLVQSKRATKSNRRSFDSAEVRFAQDDNYIVNIYKQTT
jgi:hypothetical protein